MSTIGTPTVVYASAFTQGNDFPWNQQTLLDGPGASGAGPGVNPYGLTAPVRTRKGSHRDVPMSSKTACGGGLPHPSRPRRGTRLISLSLKPRVLRRGLITCQRRPQARKAQHNRKRSRLRYQPIGLRLRVSFFPPLQIRQGLPERDVL